jgi:hypothetical protein
VPVLVELADVTGFKPAISGDVFGRLLRVVVIARSDVGSADPDLTLVIFGEVSSFGEIDKFDLRTAWNISKSLVGPF